MTFYNSLHTDNGKHTLFCYVKAACASQFLRHFDQSY